MLHCFISDCGWIPTFDSSAQGGTTVSSATSRSQCLSYCQGFSGCGAAAWTETTKTCKAFQKPVTPSSETGTILFTASCACPPTTVAVTAQTTTASE